MFQPKLNTNQPLTHSLFTQLTQTEPTLINSTELEELKIKNKELATKLETNRQDYQQKVKVKDTQITNLQSKLES